MIAQASLLCGDPESAREVWRGATGAEDDAIINFRIGMTYLVEQDYTSAMRQFDRATVLDPSKGEAHCALAICLLELGNAPSAVDEARLALDNPDISEGLKQFCERLREFAERYVPRKPD
jgi:Tfp pilus assembly protein PilF